MKATSALALIYCACLVSCSGGTNVGQSLSGPWKFTSTSTAADGGSIAGTFILTQTGSSVTGSVILTGTPCATSTSLTGNISQSTIGFFVLEGSQSVNFAGQVNDGFTTISGNYSAPDGGCTNGDHGTWSASKVVNPPVN